MDIAAMASISAYAGLKQSVGIAVAKLSMDQNQSQSQDLLKLIEASVNPNLGSNIDIKV